MIRWPWSKRGGKAAAPREAWDLDASLLSWSKEDPWTIRDAVEGVIVLGATGSGKSSGSGRFIAQSMLAAGFGGLVLTAKASEVDQWHSYARATGRLNDLLVFGSGEPLRFDFLEYEATRAGEGAGHTENIVSLLSTVMEVAERGVGASGGGRDSDPYWRNAAKQLMRNLVDLCLMATGKVSVPEIYRLVTTAPTNLEFVRSEAWRQNSACCRALAEADRRVTDPDRRHDLELVVDYFLNEFPGLSEKTRSIVVSTFTATVDILHRGLLRTLLCSGTNVTPEVIEQGKILILALPVKEYGEVGQIAQVLMKTAFQRHIERRDVVLSPRPAFMWADEAHHFVTSRDALFQTTCRSSRVATVLLTQNLANFVAALGGGEKGRAETTAIFSNLNSKLLHRNSDAQTNEWAANLIGKSLQSFASSNLSYQSADWVATAMGMSVPGQGSAGLADRYEFDLQPSAFSFLRSGGTDHGMLVDAVLYQNGRRFRASGRNYLHVTFGQAP